MILFHKIFAGIILLNLRLSNCTFWKGSETPMLCSVSEAVCLVGHRVKVSGLVSLVACRGTRPAAPEDGQDLPTNQQAQQISRCGRLYN